MAYAAVISLKETIFERLETINNDSGTFFGRLETIIKHHSLDPPDREILEFAYKQVESLQEIARRVVGRRQSRLVIEIIDAAQKLERAIKSYKNGYDGILLSINLQDLSREVHSFFERVKMMEAKMEEYDEELYSLPDEDDDVVSSRTNSGGHKSKMVGLSDQYIELKGRLMDPVEVNMYVSLVGMPGIGKTILAKKVFEDPDTEKHFDYRLWVTVGRKHRLKDIPRVILANVHLAERDEDVASCLKGKRYLIILDDVWDRHIWDHLDPSFPGSELISHFPDTENGSRILLTTRLQRNERYMTYLSEYNYIIPIRLMNEEESWDLLRENIFAEDSCPSQLEKAGRKIAENCEGLPLTIVTVADLLSEEEKTPQYWSEVAANKNHQLFLAAYDEISKVLFPSYEYLPRILQMCFLYMGVFTQNDEISRSKLINLWDADRFLERNVQKLSNDDAIKCLDELASNSLVMVHQTSIDASIQKKIKIYSLHSSLWHLSKREAKKNRFFHILSSLNDGLGEAIKCQCRLSFHNNILFCIKEVYESVEDNCASSARTLLCYGPYNQYQVQICFGLELLRVLDALKIRFYEFPLDVLQLFELRYLAFTLNGNFPASISQLSNLEYLIVSRYLSIKTHRDPSYLPVEIWSMKKLKHLQVTGSDLPDPCGASLQSLSTLSNVSAHSCTESVVKAIPNLEKLGIRIELAPEDGGKTLSCLDHISHLKFLRSLKCVVVNPEVVPPLALPSIFPSHLVKLNLNGLGYPWKEMSKIASLQYLRVLKLRNYAFRGPEWKFERKGLSSLRYLVIEDTDLAEWRIESSKYNVLVSLTIKHCYKLKKIDGEFGMNLEKIDIVDCNPLGVEQMKRAVSGRVNIEVRSSWDDGKFRT